MLMGWLDVKCASAAEELSRLRGTERERVNLTRGIGSYSAAWVMVSAILLENVMIYIL